MSSSGSRSTRTPHRCIPGNSPDSTPTLSPSITGLTDCFRAIEAAPPSDDENLAVYLGNRAACNAALGEHALVVDDCSLALEKRPDYPKVLLRRCQALEKLDKIDEALADAKKAFELDPQVSPKLPETMYEMYFRPPIVVTFTLDVVLRGNLQSDLKSSRQRR